MRRVDAIGWWPALVLAAVGCLLGVLGRALQIEDDLEEVARD